ncbi:hypothetical protein [Phytohabitans rumicis]|uniref:hypothetical protein n=1 Tax=Phytohabitans rumicis TaxID=1076125 RepID=UPI0031E82581
MPVCSIESRHAELRLVMFTAAPSTPDADKRAVLNVVGLQSMTAAEQAPHRAGSHAAGPTLESRQG